MRENFLPHDNEELNELLGQYQRLKAGRSHSFLDEESFERIIDHFDDTENLSAALEAAEIAVGQYLYSAGLTVKKADILIATHKYHEALATLEHAELLDSHDINLYILKTDAYLALDQQE